MQDPSNQPPEGTEPDPRKLVFLPCGLVEPLGRPNQSEAVTWQDLDQPLLTELCNDVLHL